MSPFRTPLSLSKILMVTVLAIFLFLPFHAFLTVWISSWVGHYTLLRLWKEALLLILLAGTAHYLYKDKKLRNEFFNSTIVRLVLLYLVLVSAVAAANYLTSTVSPKAIGYGLIVDSRFLAFFLCCIVIAKKTQLAKFNIKKWVLIPASVVAGIAFLQYLVLPYDFLIHFGYGSDTILPYQTINHDINYIRAISTMRGANPLGAYLLLVISLALAYLLAEFKRASKRWLVGALVLYTAALVFSFSRSAWIGTILSASLIVWLVLKTSKAKNALILATVALLLAGLAFAYIFRNSATLDNAIFHTSDHSKVERSSNQDHISALDSAVEDVSSQPMGGGIGSAGPASIYNKNGADFAENYFVQIAQELGLVGITLFLVIYVMIGKMLWNSKSNPASLALFTALIGLTFVNLLSHAWTDDTLSYIFFGLAGIVMSPVILELKSKHTHQSHPNKQNKI